MKLLYYFLFLLLPTVFFSGCCAPNYLESDEYLLYRNNIEGEDELDKDDLAALYRQEPNRKILGAMPYLAIYNLGRKFYDSANIAEKRQEVEERFDQRIAEADNENREERLRQRKRKRLDKLDQRLEEGNWLMRVPGEPPVIYDSTLMNRTVRQMTHYINSKGFFNGEASADVDTLDCKRIEVNYNIHEGQPYVVREIDYDILDPYIDSVVSINFENSAIIEGERYDQESLTAERERLTSLIRNQGFYNFSRQYIFFQVDTTRAPQSVYLDIIIENPEDQDHHDQYTIDQVVFNSASGGGASDTVRREGITYILGEECFSTRVLNHKILLRPGDLYNQENIERTQRQLATLDMFKFININFDENDTLNTLQTNIRTSQLRKYQVTAEGGVNVTTQAWVPGPFLNLSFKDRNIFCGFQVLEVSLRGSIEGQASLSDPNDVYRTTEFAINTSLTFPELLIPTRIRHRANESSPRTTLITGYSWVQRPEYRRQAARAGVNYFWSRNRFSTWAVSPVDINFIDSRLSTEFEDYLNELESLGNPLRVSFLPSFVSNMNGSYTFNNNELGENNRSRYFHVYAESGGTTMILFNRFLENRNRIFGNQAFRYIKNNYDLRYYFPTGRDQTFAMRFSAGFALPYGMDDPALPYEKYFFSGGSNSIRAWRPRRLGPGSYVRMVNGEPSYQFEQPGELIFETNYEYRFNIFSFFDGAVFIDAGNVWTLREDPTREGARFEFGNFFEEIAVGTGFGLRLNFGFLILRFDLGIKVYHPGLPAGERFILPDLIEEPPFGSQDQTVLNIGIGYPF